MQGGAAAQPAEIYGSALGMGITAENVAERFGVSREDQDRFALQSQQRAASAIREGRFKNEIVPVELVDKKGKTVFQTDEYPRPQTTLEALAKLKSAFKTNGTVTAGNACGLNDGASAVVLVSGQKLKELRLIPLARVVAVTAAGVAPPIMGIGPIPAVTKVLSKSGLSLGDIDLIELNEAFASQALAVIRELGLDPEKSTSTEALLHWATH